METYTDTNSKESDEKDVTTHLLTENNNERLLTVLHSLEALITKQTSLRFAFLRGAVYGLGTVIGATLLIALLGGILVTTINSLSEMPLIGNYIQNNAAEYLKEIESQ